MSSLDELFSKDPLDLTKEDLSEIVAKLRAERAVFVQYGEKKGAPKIATPVDQIKLEDLEL